MRYLLWMAIRERTHRFLLLFTLLAMIILTVASQLEVMALGLMTRRGPDAFELFGSTASREGSGRDTLEWNVVEARWQMLDPNRSGQITREEATDWVAAQHAPSLLDRLFTVLNRHVAVDQNLTGLAGVIIGIALFKAMAMFCHRFASRLIAIEVSRSLRQSYFEHIQSLPMTFYHTYNMGTLSSRVMGDSATIAEAVNACLVNYVQTPFTVLSTLCLCFLTSWRLSLLIFLGLPLILLPIFLIAQRVKRIAHQIQTHQGHFASILLDFLAGIQTIKVFAMESFSLQKYREKNDQMARLERKSARYALASRPVVHTLAMLFLAAALLYGLHVVHMPVSEVVVYCGLLYVFYEPIKKFAEENSHIQRGIAAAERMQEIMALRPPAEEAPDAIPLQGLELGIEFDEVWFRYGDEWVLKGVSFSVERGKTVALVGPTGSGKSTLAQLLPRLYEVEKGEIRIDGKPLQCYTQRSLCKQIAFVPQRPFLFLDSVAENIAFGHPASSEEIEHAACRAHADEFIRNLPNGYKTPLLEMGKNLSGGQQQRIAIARAFCKQAPILVLDEATSSLDALSEHAIKESLRQSQGQVTQLIIAHRLSTIEDADKIIYLEGGKKIGEGSKDQLLATCPPFKKMWEMMHQHVTSSS